MVLTVSAVSALQTPTSHQRVEYSQAYHDRVTILDSVLGSSSGPTLLSTSES